METLKAIGFVVWIGVWIGVSITAIGMTLWGLWNHKRVFTKTFSREEE